MSDKHKQYLELAKEFSRWSKDPSRKIGAVAINKDGVIISTGWNGFPRGFNDSPESYLNREMKNKYIIHAETNLIYNAARIGATLEGCTLYCWGLPVCSECAKAISQVGIKQVYWSCDEDIPSRWLDSYDITIDILTSLGIHIQKIV